MAHPTDPPQQYVSLNDPLPPRPRQPTGLMGSIWAPQPQPSETTWPRTLDTFSRAAEFYNRADARNAALQMQPAVSREDVFGTPQAPQNGSREIGAIGDGRKKNSPAYDDKVRICAFFISVIDQSFINFFQQHVEQLLRTLNLNSPAPFAQNKSSPSGVDIPPNSPDFSPASVSSALLTPTDLSPSGRSLDIKLHSPYEPAQTNYSFINTPSLLFEQATPEKNPDPFSSSLLAHAARPPLMHMNRPQVPSGVLPLFETFADHSRAETNGPNTHIRALSHLDLQHSIYNSPPPRRNEHARLPPIEYRSGQQTHPLPQDWRSLGLKIGNDLNLNTAQEETLRPFAYQQQSGHQSYQTSNEVSRRCLLCIRP